MVREHTVDRRFGMVDVLSYNFLKWGINFSNFVSLYVNLSSFSKVKSFSKRVINIQNR